MRDIYYAANVFGLPEPPRDPCDTHCETNLSRFLSPPIAYFLPLASGPQAEGDAEGDGRRREDPCFCTVGAVCL